MPELSDERQSELEQLRLRFNAFINERPRLETVEDMTSEKWATYREWFYQLSDVVASIEWGRMHSIKEIEALV